MYQYSITQHFILHKSNIIKAILIYHPDNIILYTLQHNIPKILKKKTIPNLHSYKYKLPFLVKSKTNSSHIGTPSPI